jgi:hypothetical protein
MKTTSYNAAKELKIGTLVIVFAVSVFTAVRVKELQLNEATEAVHTQSTLISDNNTNAPLVTTPGARLIDEPVLKIEPLIKAVEYKAAKFVETEMAIEKESFLNINNGTAEAESWMNVTEYKAADFVNAEMTFEQENYLNSNNETVEAEPLTNVTEYKAADFVNAEMTFEQKNYLNSNNETVEAEPLTNVTEYKPAKFVEAEMTHEIQKWMGTETYWTDNFMPDINTQTTQNESKLSIK